MDGTKRSGSVIYIGQEIWPRLTVPSWFTPETEVNVDPQPFIQNLRGVSFYRLPERVAMTMFIPSVHEA